MSERFGLRGRGARLTPRRAATLNPRSHVKTESRLALALRRGWLGVRQYGSARGQDEIVYGVRCGATGQQVPADRPVRHVHEGEEHLLAVDGLPAYEGAWSEGLKKYRRWSETID